MPIASAPPAPGPSAGEDARRRPGAEPPLDTAIRLITPERITFQYPLAGPFRRALAYLVDVFVWLALMLLIGMLATLLSLGTPSGGGIFRVGYFILQWSYGGFCEAVFNGQTPGKRLLGIRVVSHEGVPITGGQAVLRNLLWTVEGVIPLAFMPALVSMLLTGRFQRLGDLAAQTMVVVERRPSRGRFVGVLNREVEAILPYIPAGYAAGPELAQALSDYVRHRPRFGKARREEMAGHLARPVIARFGIPDAATNDAVLCALYHRVFLGG